MNKLRQRIDDYLTIRRGLGFKLRGYDRLLRDFADHVVQTGASKITAQLAVAWATGLTDVHPIRWKQRLAAVRGFTLYLRTFDVSVEVPAPDLLVYRHQRPTPYIYRETEITKLVASASLLKPRARAVTYQTLFALLAVTGMRVGEALRLNVPDLDLEAGLIHIRQTKFNKSRYLPLHPSAVAALEDYALERAQLWGKPKIPSFFLSMSGTRLLYVCVHSVFRKLVQSIGLQPRSGSGPPRIHDLRHSFAASTLLHWYRARADVAARMPLLSAYLGHADPVSTYWYLEPIPELLALAAERLQEPEQAR